MMDSCRLFFSLSNPRSMTLVRKIVQIPVDCNSNEVFITYYHFDFHINFLAGTNNTDDV